MASVAQEDKTILRRLAHQKAEIAALPVHDEKAAMWARLNRLEKVKPMVWINEIPWHELGIDQEHLETTDPFCRQIEMELRKSIYQWQHMPADMIVENKIYCPLVIHNSGFGIKEMGEKIIVTDASVQSHSFEPQIKDEKDIEKIKTPQLTLDEQATERNYQLMLDIFGDIMPVEKRGRNLLWFAPWDFLVMVWGVQQALMDLIVRPEMVKHAMKRLVDAYLKMLDQYEDLNALAPNNDNTRIGSGGYGYTDELPQEDFDPAHVRPIDTWGCATAQIFSEVSPDMHQEFALDFELPWLERFGLTYYGCCEPLHRKIDMLKKIPNLRKISMSPWVDIDQAAAKMDNKYVFSLKPSPAILAEETWDLDRARDHLRTSLEKASDCVVEVILKDISTVRHEPQRLWQWAQMAREVTEEFA